MTGLVIQKLYNKSRLISLLLCCLIKLKFIRTAYHYLKGSPYGEDGHTLNTILGSKTIIPTDYRAISLTRRRKLENRNIRLVLDLNRLAKDYHVQQYVYYQDGRLFWHEAEKRHSQTRYAI